MLSMEEAGGRARKQGEYASAFAGDGYTGERVFMCEHAWVGMYMWRTEVSLERHSQGTTWSPPGIWLALWPAFPEELPALALSALGLEALDTMTSSLPECWGLNSGPPASTP